MNSGDFSSPPTSSKTGGGGTRLPGLAGTESEKQLTQRELAALKTIKRNVDTTKYAGWIVGAAGTYVLLSRRKPPPRMISKLGWSVVGGLGGSFLTMPIGILLSRDVLKDVEDPQQEGYRTEGEHRGDVGVEAWTALWGESEHEEGLEIAGMSSRPWKFWRLHRPGTYRMSVIGCMSRILILRRNTRLSLGGYHKLHPRRPVKRPFRTVFTIRAQDKQNLWRTRTTGGSRSI